MPIVVDTVLDAWDAMKHVDEASDASTPKTTQLLEPQSDQLNDADALEEAMKNFEKAEKEMEEIKAR